MSASWTKALLRVGEGRGFIVGRNEQFVLTASHCLPNLPPCHSCSDPWERTFKLLGPLGGEPTIFAECLFVDPVADLAVLGPPDNQIFADGWQEYVALTELAAALPIAKLPLAGKPHIFPKGEVVFGSPTAAASAWVPALDGTWFRVQIIAGTRDLTITEVDRNIVGGMSGSPIVLDTGAAVGMICTSGEDVQTGRTIMSPGNPFLSRQLPVWLLEAITTRG
jgi:hypothetical protein